MNVDMPVEILALDNPQWDDMSLNKENKLKPICIWEEYLQSYNCVYKWLNINLQWIYEWIRFWH